MPFQRAQACIVPIFIFYRGQNIYLILVLKKWKIGKKKKKKKKEGGL